MRDFSRIALYYDMLMKDIYSQPPDPWHSAQQEQVIMEWCIPMGCKTVLDVGCGEGTAQELFNRFGIEYTGVCLGEDFLSSMNRGNIVRNMDFNFLEYSANAFDLIYSRHSLEHSPFPLFSLMEWHRVAIKYLCLVLPNPEGWGWAGQNHYSLQNFDQAKFLLERAGWKVIRDSLEEKEFKFMAEKVNRR